MTRVTPLIEGAPNGMVKVGADPRLHRMLLQIDADDSKHLEGIASYFGHLDGRWESDVTGERVYENQWGSAHSHVKMTPPEDVELWRWHVSRLQTLMRLWDAVILSERPSLSEADKKSLPMSKIREHPRPLNQARDAILDLAWNGSPKTAPIERLLPNPLYTATTGSRSDHPRGRKTDPEARPGYCVEHDHGSLLQWRKLDNGRLGEGMHHPGTVSPAVYVGMARSFVVAAFDTTAATIMRVRLDPVRNTLGWEPVGVLGVLYAMFAHELAGEALRPSKRCAGCGLEFRPRRSDQDCCGPACRTSKSRKRAALRATE